MSNENTNWALNFYDVPGRNILNTEGVGQATAGDIRKLIDELVKKGKAFGGKWATYP